LKPLRLVMSAFGPYADIVTLDFTALGQRSFFVIHGPTGAGKTTVLDAICFALYGVTSGAERDGSDMRSDFADRSLPTEVTFDFRIGPEVYRIWRCPEQERPRKRGAGFVTTRAEAALWKRTGIGDPQEEGTVLESGWSKATEAVEGLLGFKNSQFRQVVLLPQGEFRRILTADSRERQAILETLFRTEIYRRIEEALKDSAKGLRTEMEKTEAQRQWTLQEAGVSGAEELEERRRNHAAELKQVINEGDVCRTAAGKARERLAAGEKARELIVETEAAQAFLAELEQRRPDIETKRVSLVKARQAAALFDAEEALKSRNREAEEAAKIHAAKAAELGEARRVKAEADARLSVRLAAEPEIEQLTRKMAALADYVEKVKSLAEANEAAARAMAHTSAAKECLDQKSDLLVQVQKEVEGRTKIHLEVIKEAAEAPGREALAREAARIWGKGQLLQSGRQELAAVEQAWNRADARHQQAQVNYARARDELVVLQEAWHQGQASILAGELREGTPCPVCGSTVHPVPAVSGGSLPTEKDVKTKQASVANLEKVRDQAARELNVLAAKKAAVQEKVHDLEAELGDRAQADPDILQAAAAEAAALLTGARNAADRAGVLAVELESLKDRENRIREELKSAETGFNQSRLTLESLKMVVRERESTIPEAFRTPEALKKALESARNRSEELKKALDRAKKDAEEAALALVAAETAVAGAAASLEAAGTRAEAEGRSFANRLTAAGFATIFEYEESRQTPEQIGELEKLIKGFEESLGSARDRLERARAASKGHVAPDLDNLAREAAAAESAVQEVFGRQIRLQEHLEREAVWLGRLRELSDRLRGLEEKYRVHGRLAEVANGRNAYGLTFQRFVLGALLDDVTIAATERLKLMSRGRFHLQRTLDRARSNAAGGLELEVFDTYTGTTRGVSTLSGGESFLASLSLALGLADVVQSYSGGVHLDTIFVDEGFGSLDPESLDFAIRTLIDLQEGGRLVGIISHVPELKERIDARLEVRATDRGSTAFFTVSPG